jgi:hypothetical protein
MDVPPTPADEWRRHIVEGEAFLSHLYDENFVDAVVGPCRVVFVRSLRPLEFDAAIHFAAAAGLPLFVCRRQYFERAPGTRADSLLMSPVPPPLWTNLRVIETLHAQSRLLQPGAAAPAAAAAARSAPRTQPASVQRSVRRALQRQRAQRPPARTAAEDAAAPVAQPGPEALLTSESKRLAVAAASGALPVPMWRCVSDPRPPVSACAVLPAPPGSAVSGCRCGRCGTEVPGPAPSSPSVLSLDLNANDDLSASVGSRTASNPASATGSLLGPTSFAGLLGAAASASAPQTPATPTGPVRTPWYRRATQARFCFVCVCVRG